MAYYPFEFAFLCVRPHARCTFVFVREYIVPSPARKENAMKKKRQTEVLSKCRCDTIYIVEYATSENARETALDKVKKLVLNEAESLAKVKVS